MNLTVEQVKAYNDYMNLIKTTIDITLETLRNASKDRLKEVIINNGIVWTNIRNDIDNYDCSKEKKLELMGKCVEGYKEYCTKMKIFMES